MTSAIFQCDEGFSPSSEMTAYCSSNLSWIPDPRNHKCYYRAEDNELSLGTILVISASCIISGMLLWMCGMLSGLYFQSRVKRGARNNVHPNAHDTCEVPGLLDITSQDTSNPVYEVICDASSTQVHQLCDNVAYGHIPEMQ